LQVERRLAPVVALKQVAFLDVLAHLAHEVLLFLLAELFLLGLPVLAYHLPRPGYVPMPRFGEVSQAS